MLTHDHSGCLSLFLYHIFIPLFAISIVEYAQGSNESVQPITLTEFSIEYLVQDRYCRYSHFRINGLWGGADLRSHRTMDVGLVCRMVCLFTLPPLCAPTKILFGNRETLIIGVPTVIIDSGVGENRSREPLIASPLLHYRFHTSMVAYNLHKLKKNRQ